MWDGGGEASTNRRFLGVMKFRLQLSRPAESRRHVIEQFSELAHFVVATAGRNAKRKISAGDTPRPDRKRLDWSREPPDNDRGQAGCDQQNGKRIKLRLPRL